MYFQYIDLENKSDKPHDMDRALAISKALSEIEIQDVDSKNAFLLDFESDPMVRKRLRLLNKKLKAEFKEAGKEDTAERKALKILVQEFLLDLKKGERVLQHGDLFWDNFSSSYVIDWDRMGLYPFGYDL